MSMLAILAIAGGTLMTILYSMMRNAGKKDELAELLEEEQGPPQSGDREEEKLGGDEKIRQPWEKDSEWWKE